MELSIRVRFSIATLAITLVAGCSIQAREKTRKMETGVVGCRWSYSELKGGVKGPKNKDEIVLLTYSANGSIIVP